MFKSIKSKMMLLGGVPLVVAMGSGGAAFVDELSDQREKTNEKRAELENFIEPIDRGGQSEEFHETLNNAVNKLSMLDEHREDVNNQSIPDEQGLDFLHST